MQELQVAEPLSPQEQALQLQCAFNEMDAVVFKGYLDNIQNYPIVPVEPSELNKSPAINRTRLQKVSRIIYDRSEDILNKFNSVFSAMHSCGSSVVVILKGGKEYTDVYIGTSKADSDAGNSGVEALETLKASFQGNFPGITMDSLYQEEVVDLLQPIEGDKFKAVASIAGVPSLKSDDTDTFSQGLEKIIEGMRGREYVAIIQASPVSRQELERVEGAYQSIYTSLSPFEQQQLSLTENESRTLGTSVTKSITKTLSRSIGKTVTSTTGTNSSTTSSSSKTRSAFDLKRALSMAASGAVTGGIAAGSVTGGMTAPVGALVGGLGGLGAGLFGGSDTESDSTTTGTNTSLSNADTRTGTEGESEGETQGTNDASTTGIARTRQVTEKNRHVSALLSSIDNQLNRIEECKNYGMWSWSAKFLAENELDVRLGADLYSGILRGNATGLERNSIAVWKKGSAWDESSKGGENFKSLKRYISRLQHPVFESPDYFLTAELSHVSLISTKEMTVAMSLPQKSLPGIPIFDSVAFGRSISMFDSAEPEKIINIGSIFNFGAADKNCKVSINTQSLASHVFVTGSTGSGKSNAVYLMLDKLYSEQKIPFLIIEPAKGEYKQVFGGREGVHVFGTNAKLTPLLRLNPFSFPENIHIMEHIDRLIEILNAVWPMYAAMPAILKEAVECAYKKSGWDLSSSKCRNGLIFPDFHELMDVLPGIINSSDYSQEMKGNYSGALITRVRSLTNGYFSTIFQRDELSLAELFDEPCIVDLSRVGSSETKSLLMGIIFLKLQEYRMSKASGTNAELRHITVLEEAHNLLRRTSSTQSSDSSNLQGKSVEMISNAIAEMRTYGEGFIIADQAPGLLDQSVIRNTNTKIILRLPDFDDRNLVGKAAHLSDEQIDELSRLKTGCAAVYQNNWLEPVLCQFEHFGNSNAKPFVYESEADVQVDKRQQSRTALIKLLAHVFLEGLTEHLDTAPIIAQYERVHGPSDIKLTPKQELLKTTAGIIKLSKILDRIEQSSNFNVWLTGLMNEVYSMLSVEALSEKDKVTLQEMLLRSIDCDNHKRKFFDDYIEKLKMESGYGI